MHDHSTSFWMTTKGFAALGLIGAATYFLLVEHRQHVFLFLPYLIFLACPLMHLFMHSGHHHKDHGNTHDQEKEAYRRGLEEGKKQHADNHESH
jgi:hypothetical protein